MGPRWKGCEPGRTENTLWHIQETSLDAVLEGWDDILQVRCWNPALAAEGDALVHQGFPYSISLFEGQARWKISFEGIGTIFALLCLYIDTGL